MKKPTGKNGVTRVSINSDGKSETTFIANDYPEGKDDIEEHIVKSFISSANRDLSKYSENFLLSNPRKNDLDDFDFTVDSFNGDAYLELMEAAALKGAKGGYKNAPKQYRVIDFVDFIYEKLKPKSDKYPNNMKKELFLLIYTTHFSFSLTDSAVIYLRWLLRENPLVFNAIFLFNPIDNEYGEVRWLFPVPPELLDGFNPELITDNVVHSLAPDGFEVV